MTTPRKDYNDYADLLHGQDDPALAHLVADIDQALRAPAPPSTLRAAFERELHQRTIAARHPRTSRPGNAPWPLMRLRSLVAAVTLVIALVLGGVIAPRLQPGTPVSAQMVLDRAAARNALPANVVIHQIFTDRSVTRGAVCARTTNVWTQYDARGRVTAYNARFRSCLLGMGPHNTDTFQGYLPTQEMQLGRRHILIIMPPHVRPSVSIYVRRSSMRKFEPPGAPLADWAQPLRDVQHAYGQAKQLLPSRLLGGQRVEVVQVKPAPSLLMTLYIDAHDYHLRAVSTVSVDRSYSSFKRLLRYERVSLSHVPKGVFVFTAPPGATVTASS